MAIAVSCSALLGILLFGLGCAITLQRRRSRTYFGCEEDPTSLLYRLIRAHGNTAEYAPTLCVLMLLTQHRQCGSWTEATAVAVTACRYFQAAGMLIGPTMNAPPNSLRLLGTSGTYLGGLLLCVALLISL